MIKDVIKRNKDVEDVLYASCKYGIHKYGKSNIEKLLSILVVSDVHQCVLQLKSAIKYLNHYDAIDLGMNLGDMQARNYAETNGKWYKNAINKCNKPFLTVLGNHDVGNSTDKKVSATADQAFNKFIKAAIHKADAGLVEKPYYSKRMDDYKVEFIVLNNYDNPNDIDDCGNFMVSRGETCFSQNQVDWFINELLNVPKEYGVIICLHDFPCAVNIIECGWSQTDAVTADDTQNMLCDIVNAWINGEDFYAEYLQGGNKLTKVKVNCVFSKRGKGDFISYFSGHRHQDIIAESEKYPEQKVIYFPAMAMDEWQNFCSDLPRVKGTKTEDVFTVVSVNRETRELRLVRIGSYITSSLIERKYFVVKY